MLESFEGFLLNKCREKGMVGMALPVSHGPKENKVEIVANKLINQSGRIPV